MINSITEQNINKLNEIGLLYDSDFIKHYHIKDYINNPIYKIYTYEVNDEIVAFIISTIIQQELEILAIYVKEAFRRNKIATKLINHLIDNNFANRILLEVSSLNINAINLYKKLGFKIISKRLNYYKDSDALIMERSVI